MKIIPLPSETTRSDEFTHKIVIAYTDLTAAAGSQTLTIFPDGSADAGLSNATLAQLPAGFTVKSSQMRLITPFTGGSISAATLTIGDKASANRYMASSATDLFTAAGTNTKDNVASATAYAFTTTDVANSNAQITATIATTGGNVSTATAGLLEIYLQLVDTARISGVIEPGSV